MIKPNSRGGRKLSRLDQRLGRTVQKIATDIVYVGIERVISLRYLDYGVSSPSDEFTCGNTASTGSLNTAEDKLSRGPSGTGYLWHKEGY